MSVLNSVLDKNTGNILGQGIGESTFSDMLKYSSSTITHRWNGHPQSILLATEGLILMNITVRNVRKISACSHDDEPQCNVIVRGRRTLQLHESWHQLCVIDITFNGGGMYSLRTESSVMVIFNGRSV